MVEVDGMGPHIKIRLPVLNLGRLLKLDLVLDDGRLLHWLLHWLGLIVGRFGRRSYSTGAFLLLSRHMVRVVSILIMVLLAALCRTWLHLLLPNCDLLLIRCQIIMTSPCN